MTTRSLAVLAIALVGSRLSAGTPSIGSVISQGDLWIDNHAVRTSGTLFDGSVVETGSGETSSAEARLGNNVRVRLYAESRGELYWDHFVLLRGRAEVAASTSFRAEVTGLVISTSEPNTTGLISIARDGVVNLSAQAGSLRVANPNGALIAQVRPQAPLALSPQAGGGWRAGAGSNSGFDRDRHHCYVESDDDRDCDHHHHHHPSK